jgi:hypothetical protein
MGVLADGTARRALAVLSPTSDGRELPPPTSRSASASWRTHAAGRWRRAPRQHLLFSVDGEAGLSSILAGRAGPASSTGCPVPTLYVLPVGTLPPNPLELVQRPQALPAGAELTKFDHVIVDTPAAVTAPTARAGGARQRCVY